MRVGVLTGGGDCPGLNAAIRAVVRKCEVGHSDEVIGYLDGWRGVIEGEAVPLDVERCRGILPRGGTILGTSRTNPFKIEGATERAEAIDRLHTTAESHDRVIVCEVMGRHAGWIATYAGIAGGATVILVPEEPFDIDAVCAYLEHRHSTGRFASIVVTAEGALPAAGTISIASPELDQFGHPRLGGIGNTVADEVERRTGFEARVTILGHVQRGGTPSAFDRVLAT